MGVEPAGQRSERGHDDLVRAADEAAAGDLPPFQVKPQLGMKVARYFRPRLTTYRLMAKDDSADLDFIGDSAAASDAIGRGLRIA